MARYIDRASNEYLELSSTVVTAAPLTVSAWARTDVSTTTDDYCIVQIGDASEADHYFRLSADGSGDPGELAWGARGGSGSALAQARSSIIPTVDQWYHMAGIEISSSSRRLLVDGTDISTNTSSRTPTGVDTITIGRERDSTPDDSWSGDVAEVGIWDVALTDAEAISLSAGYSPLFIRPQNLVFYAPLIRDVLDRVSGSTLTLGGTPDVSDHIPIIYPSPQFVLLSTGGGPPATEQTWIEYVSRHPKFSNIRR